MHRVGKEDRERKCRNGRRDDGKMGKCREVEMDEDEWFVGYIILTLYIL